MIDKLEERTKVLLDQVTSDNRWNLQDELMFQVLGHTLYGYAFGFGRMSLFLDVEDINKVVIQHLTSLGAGEEYVRGMIESASSTFTSEENNSMYSQLVGVGHSYFASEDLTECVNSIFANTQSLSSLQKKPWWQFWR